MKEIEAFGEISYAHIKDKYVSDKGKTLGIDPSYSVRLAIDKHGDVHKQLVAEAKNLGLVANTDSLRYSDGDEITMADGTRPYAGKYLIDVSSKWPVSIVDIKGNDITLEDEPGNGTLANVAFKIGVNKNKDKLNYFLTGVQLLKAKKNEFAPHKFGEFTQTSLLDDDDDEEPSF